MLGNEQTGLAQGIFLFPFSSGDHTSDSGQNPHQHHAIHVAPKGEPGSDLPQVPQSVAEFKKRKKKPKPKKDRKKNQNYVSSAVGALTTEAAVLSMEAAPVLLHGRGGGG